MGLALLILGSRWLVVSAITIAESMGVSELVIGLTIVAASTSLPEVATSIISSLHGQRDIRHETAEVFGKARRVEECHA